MDRYTFDNLHINEQIQYINNKLLEGNTLTNTCKDIGIGRTTIRNRFKQHGYEFNQAKKLYISIVEVVELESSSKVVMQESSNKVVGADTNNINNLRDILYNFNEMNTKLNEVYSWYESQSSNKVVGANKLNIDDFKGNIVTRSYKVYEDIQKEFVIFCEANKKYRVQDIISQALKDFMDKYK
ncbi:hypothetical protein IR152_19400 [Clostridioides sp. ES-S-0108-01]|uniref:hypothetical protein n=1 Tax=unclassified Clostridioides TaxID=2635829 RepID=UPI001D0C01E6|nr:hypothetical protein [Clostridioides sp. ES-S-0107-01]MCC0785150.1 hypothetical protein [Clostridioides sp. ES-S-0108-01]UDN53019.1 hypothetical protein JJC16_18305 [Clostridioides sp. ES-S-0107-01]